MKKFRSKILTCSFLAVSACAPDAHEIAQQSDETEFSEPDHASVESVEQGLVTTKYDVGVLMHNTTCDNERVMMCWKNEVDNNNNSITGWHGLSTQCGATTCMDF